MTTVDAHVHLGDCRVFGLSQPLHAVLSAMDDHGVDTAVVQPYPGSPDAVAEHDAIAAAARDHDGRVVGLASLNPHTDPAAYRTEIARCVNDLGFVGVKLHPLGHAVSPGSDDARLVLDTAAELGVPVMIHTGPGFPFADPARWMAAARSHPELTFVFAHAGAGLFTGTAIAVARECPNVVLETSWCNPQDILAAIATLGSDRVMFGSDMLLNIPVEQAKYRAIDVNGEVLAAVMGGTAQRVFGLDAT